MTVNVSSSLYDMVKTILDMVKEQPYGNDSMLRHSTLHIPNTLMIRLEALLMALDAQSQQSILANFQGLKEQNQDEISMNRNFNESH